MNTAFLVFWMIVLAMLIVASYVIASFGITMIFGAPYVATPKSIIREMLKVAGVKKEDVVIDLGSGNGDALFVAVEEFGAKQAIGYEINPLLVMLSRVKARRKGLHKQVKTYWKNLKRADLTTADVIFLYLFPGVMKQIEKKLPTMKKNAMLVSRGFEFKKKQPIETHVVQNSHLYLYDTSFEDKS